MSDESQNDSSEHNFYTFLGSIMFVIAIPLIYSIITIIFKNTKEFNKSNYINCKCSKCKERIEKYHSRLNRAKYNKYFYFKLLLLIVVLYLAYTSLMYVQSESDKINYNEFDPYDILNVSVSADVSAVKKAYRKIITKRHPDRLIKTGMTQKEIDKIRKDFILIVKAYEILTNPDKKYNWEKFGNPDGPKSGLGIVLPSFIISTKFQMPILIIFLVLIMVVLPLYVMFYLRGESEYDENGFSKTNTSIYYHFINENLHTKHIPFILGLSIEFKNIKINSNEEKELNELWVMCKGYIPNTKYELIPFSNKKAITLIYAWLSRMDNISESLKEDTNRILEISLKVYPKIIEFALNVNKAKRLNKKIKTFGFFCTKSLIEFSQCLHQRLWFDNSPYLQLPNLTQDEVNLYNKKNKKTAMTLAEYLKLSEEKMSNELKVIKPDLNKVNLDEMILVSKSLPFYETEIKYYVQGLEDFLVHDVITIEVNVQRKGMENNLNLIGMSHSSYIDETFEEQISLLFCSQSSDDMDNKKLIDSNITSINKFHIKSIFMFQPEESKVYNFSIEVLPLNFAGLEFSKNFTINVLKKSQKREEFYKQIKEIDKKENYDEMNTMQKLVNTIAGFEDNQEKESDSEDDMKQKKNN